VHFNGGTYNLGPLSEWARRLSFLNDTKDKMQEIELTPIDKSKPFHKVLVYIDKSVINTTKVFEKTGNRYTYSVSGLKTDAAIADATFQFDVSKYPGVEVVDLR
jgi:hypothetical protein